MDSSMLTGPGTKSGTIGGTLLVIFLHISSAEIFKTVVIAAVGASVSFTMTVLLRWGFRKIKEWKK